MTEQVNIYTGKFASTTKTTVNNWYEHQPEAVSEGKNVKELWDFAVNTDSTSMSNRLDQVLKDQMKKIPFN